MQFQIKFDIFFEPCMTEVECSHPQCEFQAYHFKTQLYCISFLFGSFVNDEIIARSGDLKFQSFHK